MTQGAKSSSYILMIYSFITQVTEVCKNCRSSRRREIGKKRGVWLKEVNDVVVIIGNYNSSNVNYFLLFIRDFETQPIKKRHASASIWFQPWRKLLWEKKPKSSRTIILVNSGASLLLNDRGFVLLIIFTKTSIW